MLKNTSLLVFFRETAASGKNYIKVTRQSDDITLQVTNITKHKKSEFSFLLNKSINIEKQFI